MDRDGSSVLVAVELTCLPTAAAVHQWTETAAVCSLQDVGLVWRRRQRWIGGQKRRQFAGCSRADVSADVGGGGSVDRDGGQCARCRQDDMSGEGSGGLSVDRDRGQWRLDLSGDGGGGGSVDRDGGQCALCRQDDVSGDGGGASVDTDGGTVLVAVELTCLPTAAAVDRWTKTVAVCSLQSS